MNFSQLKFCLFLIFWITSCTKDENINTDAKQEIAVLAELKNDTAPRIHLALISHNGSNEYSHPLNSNTSVFIIENDIIQKKLIVENPDDGYFWIAPDLLISSNKNYTLKIHHLDEEITSTTSIPDLPKISIVKDNAKNNSFKAKIGNIDNEHGHHVIITIKGRKYQNTGSSKVYLSDWEAIQSTTSDLNTDNIKYGELKAPYNRIYVKVADENIIDFTALHDESSTVTSEKWAYRISIKSVYASLYNFMYIYDAQKNLDFILDVIPPANTRGNINNGIGVFAGSTESIFDFEE